MRAARIVAIAALMSLAACNYGGSQVSDAGATEGGNAGVFVYTDPATGCDYLGRFAASEGALTPRLRPDGLPYCDGKRRSVRPEEVQ